MKEKENRRKRNKERKINKKKEKRKKKIREKEGGKMDMEKVRKNLKEINGNLKTMPIEEKRSWII